MITLTIDGKEVSVPEGSTILEAARALNLKIPTLCYLDLEKIHYKNQVASCRVCVVEVEGRRNLAPACATPVTPGMKVTTNSKRVLLARRKNLELIISNHPFTCLTCAKSTECELQAMAWEYDVQVKYPNGERMHHKKDLSSAALYRDPDKCIMCRRCETMCNEVQTVGALTAFGRGFSTIVAPAEKNLIVDSPCVYCGQCVSVCPTGALTGHSYINHVWNALFDPTKKVVVQVAPAVRVALGEEFGYPAGEIVTGKMVSGLRKLGFDAVFDTTFGADLTIIEEGTEIIQRLTTNENLPILTSCCPGWINFIRYYYPSLEYMPSTTKSPQQMTGAIIKSYYAEKMGWNPKDIVVVSIMPCIAKKYEASLPNQESYGVRDVDYSLTTRELAKILKEGSVDLRYIEEEDFDSPLGESTGAGIIFGATGGVLEAALRSVYELVTKKTLENVDFVALRGLEGAHEAIVDLGDRKIRVAAVSGLGNARQILDKVVSGEEKFDVIEIMACPGGCINGGGQPYTKDRDVVLQKRMESLYQIDREDTLRKSHQNPEVLALYKNYLGEPGGHKAHELLHVENFDASVMSEWEHN